MTDNTISSSNHLFLHVNTMRPNRKIDFDDLLFFSNMCKSRYNSYDIVGDTTEIDQLVKRHDTINTSRWISIDYSDIHSTLSKTATNYVVTGRAEGENAVIDAFNEALTKLPNGTGKIDKMLVLLWYSSGSQVPYKQITSLSRCIGNLSHDIDTIWGFSPDDKLSERQVAITLIAASKDSDRPDFQDLIKLFYEDDEGNCEYIHRNIKDLSLMHNRQTGAIYRKDMTFEEFKELALNPPRRNEETIFEVIEYDVCDLPGRKRSHYPAFDVRNHRVGICHTLPEAESLMRKAIERANGYHDEIYCFHIKEYPVGELISSNRWEYGESWRLYDPTGRFLDKTYCSDLRRDHRTKYGQYRGRPKESFRFKKGEIVEVLDGDQVRLAVTTGVPLSIEWYWDMRERIKSQEGVIFKRCDKSELTEEEVEEAYISDSGDDQVPVIDGPSYDTHEHVHILNIMPLRYPLSRRLRKRYEDYYKAMLKEEENILNK